MRGVKTPKAPSSARKPAAPKPPTHRHARALIAAGYSLVAGIDEVGRGCWAGPVVAASVILPPRLRLPGVTDSKLLSHPRRVELARLIKRRAVAVGIGWVSAADIDAHGLTWAVRQSGLRALERMQHSYDAVLLDGNHNYLRDICPAQAIIKGDQLSLQVAAASIVAKVARDYYMTRLARALPGYGFELHKGYGTPAHRRALAELGPSPCHRQSWAPFAALEAAGAHA
jgi:ribonuclease HII